MSEQHLGALLLRDNSQQKDMPHTPNYQLKSPCIMPWSTRLPLDHVQQNILRIFWKRPETAKGNTQNKRSHTHNNVWSRSCRGMRYITLRFTNHYTSFQFERSATCIPRSVSPYHPICHDSIQKYPIQQKIRINLRFILDRTALNDKISYAVHTKTSCPIPGTHKPITALNNLLPTHSQTAKNAIFCKRRKNSR